MSAVATNLTKFAHSCVRLAKAERTMVIDPGVFSDPTTALAGADAVLITHEHPDHLDADALRAAASADPALRIWAPAAVATALRDLGDQVSVAEVGTGFDVAGFSVRAFGGQHALIHPLVPMVANVGYLIDDALYHPGDSFTVPPVDVSTLLVPIHAPWSKVAEVIDFVIAVGATQAFQIHDALLTETGVGLVEGHVSRFGAVYGTQYRHVATGDTVELV